MVNSANKYTEGRYRRYEARNCSACYEDIQFTFFVNEATDEKTSKSVRDSFHCGGCLVLAGSHFAQLLNVSAFVYCRYPAVFWYSKMIFSLIFSFMLLLATAHYVVSYCIAALFYKLTVNLDSVTPNLQMVLSPSVGIVLFLLADTVMFLSAISIFNYGYLHYNEAHKKFLRSHQKSGRLSPPPTGCQGYFPHTIATASLVLFVALRGAMVYDSVTVYRNLSHNVALASIVFDVSYMLIWISLWFCFTIKQEWSFKILAFRFPTGLSLSEIYTIQNDHTLSTNSLNGPLPNGHVTTGAADGENEEDPIPKKKKKARPILADISNPQFPGFETGLGSPTSALRKSGERKQNRVTFEDSRDETDGADALLRAAPERSSCQDAAGSDQGSAAQPAGSSGGRSGTPHGTPVNAKRKFKRELAARIHGTDGDAENGDSSQPPVSSDVPGVSTEPMDDEPRRKVNRNIFGDFELSETPENTLKRNYRNSLRSKCGQYYRDSREFSSPPAAQSSPVLPPRRVSRERTSRTESPNRASQGSGWPKAEPPEKSHPRNYSPGRPLHKRERLPSPDRKAAFSYTNPVVTTETSSFDDLSRSSSNLPPNSSFSSGLHSQNSESFPQLPARVGKVSHPNLSVQSSSPRISVELPPHLQPRATRNSDITNSKRLQPRRRVPPFPANTTAPPNREIQVVKSKPDMGRRDSALPSSNETSSNDSQDVLCSQV